MEEWIGQWWHRVVTRLADRQHLHAAVALPQMASQLAVVFRAMGGAPQWRLASAAERQHQGERSWLQRVAGSGDRTAMPVLDAETLALPPVIATYGEAPLNRELYLWLAGQGAYRLQAATCGPTPAQANGGADQGGDWIQANLQASAALLRHYPGWRARYRRLVVPHLQGRPDPARLRGRAALAELAVAEALRHSLHWLDQPDQPLTLPGQGVLSPPVEPHEVQAVCCWVDLLPAVAQALASRRDEDLAQGNRPEQAGSPDATRRRARQTTEAHDRSGMMLMFRAESLLSWADFVRVNRQTDDDDDGHAHKAAQGMDTLAVAPGGQTLASRVRFDLDLPSAAADDTVIAEGIRLPEWDHRQARLLPERCAVQVLLPQVQAPWQVPPALRVTASRMRRKLETLRAIPRWQGGYTSGECIDMDAWVRHHADRQGDSSQEPRVYARPQRSARSLATLLLADLSLSTDAWATQEARVIDVIRDALYVFGQAMDGLGDPFEMLGFSSVRRQHVRVHALKRFDEAWGAPTRDRVGAIKPGYYTRMGAAVRYASGVLAQRPERQRLLLLLTDGKPNDLDHYEGRFGIEDTRQAVQAARAAGLLPFCITIDERAADYLPYLFGSQGYAWVRRPQDLVQRLTQVVATLSA